MIDRLPMCPCGPQFSLLTSLLTAAAGVVLALFTLIAAYARRGK